MKCWVKANTQDPFKKISLVSWCHKKMVREALERRLFLFPKLEFEIEAGRIPVEILACGVSQVKKGEDKELIFTHLD